MSVILITGAAGYLGSQLGQALMAQGHKVVGIDRVTPALDFAVFQMDIRATELVDFMREHEVSQVVHLASIVSPGADEALEYDIDVNGTRNVLDACMSAGVKHITITSSGAAYGYHADNPDWIDESCPLRGNDSFSYSRHKRLVEGLLAEYRKLYPQLEQLILRPGTILGETTQNMITQLLTRKRLLAVKGSPSPFVFIWDQDMVNILIQGVTNRTAGIFNVAGDGALTVHDIAALTERKVMTLPAWLLRAALWLGHGLKLSQAGPNHLLFLQYRPVLLNQALKENFGYTPAKSSREVFELFWAAHGARQKGQEQP
ncbi:SDR family oxidoreductase [Aliidiomarina celeris]|uniref:SDR family oxidoreductase n=1 Tax=Aliidiomarina celeris TaxID=2249428 RepID=UPI000DEBA87A|nr:SDR family oxidoreductase [Aliidiomarina celeris]